MRTTTLCLALLLLQLSRCFNLVTFGDSYTDEGRLLYMFKHGREPPPGLILPPSSQTASGGFNWPRVVAQRTGVSSYNFAVAGAMCSNDLVPDRKLDATGAPFPSVSGYEMDAFEAAAAMGRLGRPQETVYALWIGTNDLGENGLLSGRQRPNATIEDVVDCMWSVINRLYDAGGRRFVVFNMISLEKAPLYGGPGSKAAENRNKLRKYTSSVNALLDEDASQLLRWRWSGATLSLLDVHSIVTDVIAKPNRYLDAPANTAIPFHNCEPPCVDSPGKLSGYLWWVTSFGIRHFAVTADSTRSRYDLLHPSARIEEVFAQEFIDLLQQGNTRFGKTFQG